ncbi:MAG TPA: hypothetical protein VH253_10680 [Phycisphaerae bacterium]|nr:hypothetical protein [Phycisphaerae bacterium]
MPTPLPPPPLNYQPPTPPSSDTKNRWWKVLLRISAGGILGAAAILFGIYLYSLTSQPILGFLPVLILFALALFITIKFHRFGYTAGVILAPFFLAAATALLLLIICGGYALTK